MVNKRHPVYLCVWSCFWCRSRHGVQTWRFHYSKTYNELHDLEAEMLKMVFKDVQIEPYSTVQIVLQKINGGVLTPGKKRAADARLNIHALTILFLMTTATCICLLFVALCARIFVGQNITRFRSNFKRSVRRNWINDFVPVWPFKWRLTTTFLDAIRVFTLLIFHPSDFIIFQTRSLSTSTLKRGNEILFQFRPTMLLFIFSFKFP